MNCSGPQTEERAKMISDLPSLARGIRRIAAMFSLVPLMAAAGAGRRPVVCVDPGHPSEIHNGMELLNGTTETHCNWVVAIRLKKLLDEAGYRVVMTKRRENEFVKNGRRA